jgi:hypothetical protein
MAMAFTVVVEKIWKDPVYNLVKPFGVVMFGVFPLVV